MLYARHAECRSGQSGSPRPEGQPTYDSLAPVTTLLVVGSAYCTAGHAASDRLNNERNNVGDDEDDFEGSAGEPALLRGDVRDHEAPRPVQRSGIECRRNDQAADLFPERRGTGSARRTPTPSDLDTPSPA